MLEPGVFETISGAIRSSIEADRHLLDEMRAAVRPLRSATRRIQHRTATAISLVGTDGGNNEVRFDPFLLELVRVVDSSQKEYCLEVVTPTVSVQDLDRRHLDAQGHGRTPLGKMMERLGVAGLAQLSPVFKKSPDERSNSWVMVYRELSEWAVLLSLVREESFGTDTVIVRDGLLRSKMFSSGLFGKYAEALEEAIRLQFERRRRRVHIVGIAKHSKVLHRYRLAMALEGVMRNAYPCYVAVPQELEERVYKWSEYAKGGGEGEQFVAGKMFLAKFGRGPHDPVWALDIWKSQVDQADVILGYLLADAVDGFPIPFYPSCLQRAHEHAALVDFDMDILQDQISKALREVLGDKRDVVDEMDLQHADLSERRYQ